MLRDLWKWCMDKNIRLQTTLLRSEDDLADIWSRPKQDRGDYTMDGQLFKCLQDIMQPWISPKVDMFASPGNHQLAKFVSRTPHWEAVGVNALHCPLENFTEVYANPPWTIILPWLNRLWNNPHIKCLMITPYWVGAPWWPLLVKLQIPHTPAILVPPYRGMFTNCLGQSMNAPKWPLICTLLSGEHFRPNKFHLKTQTLF